MQIVLYSDDINLLDYWQESINRECHIVYDLEDLYRTNSSLIVINHSACKPTCKEVLQKLIANYNKILVLHRVPDFETAKTLLMLGAMGYGNALMREHFLISAIQAIEEGMVWLYPEFTTKLILQIDKKSDSKEEVSLERLSEREREVASLLKEGFTYNDIATQLDITTRTVKEHAKHIYSKLNVKDRLALALLLR